MGVRLRQARLGRHLSQVQAGDAIGVTHGTVGQWERGETLPTLENLIGVADLYGASLDWLVWGMGTGIETRLKSLPKVLREPLRARLHQQIDEAEELARRLPREMQQDEHVKDSDERLQTWAAPDARRPVRRTGK